MIAMLATSRGCLLFGFCFLLSTGASWAQFTAIAGDVKGPDGQKLKGAEILIEREGQKGTYKGAKTDKNGHYIYNGLPIGKYTVSVMVDGQKRDQMSGVTTKLGDPTELNFDLKKAAEQQAALPAGTPAQEQARGMSKEDREKLDKQAKENAAIMAKNKALNDAFNAGKEAMNAKNYDAAIESFQKGVEMDPNQNVIFANLADAYVGLAATKTGADQQAAQDKALDAFQKAIALKPDDPAYHNNYALALARAKKFDEAQGELNKAAQLDPPNAGRYYYNLGALLVNNGQIAASEASFQKAIEANPNYGDAQFQYATALSAKLVTGPDGKIIAPPGMKEALEKYLALEPTGQFADAAKGMLQMIGATVQTNYSNPNAPKKGAPAKK
jgi:tetratricopeptide (TPR) repeat protein